MVGLLGQQQNSKQQLKVATTLFTFYSLVVWAFAMSLNTQALLLVFAGIILGINYLTPKKARRRLCRDRALACYFICLSYLVRCSSRYPSSVLNEGYPDRGGGLWEIEKEKEN